MNDDLARRMAVAQVAAARNRVVSEADRLAVLVTRFAEDVRSGRSADGAWQIAQSATDLLRRSAHLEGLAEIIDLISG